MQAVMSACWEDTSGKIIVETPTAGVVGEIKIK